MISAGVGNFATMLPHNWLSWQRPLRYRKKKVVQICPVDPEIALLKFKKKTTDGKLYSPVGRFAERANEPTTLCELYYIVMN